jgi:hypothetical protein
VCALIAVALLVWPSTPDVASANAAVPGSSANTAGVPLAAPPTTRAGADTLIAVVVNGDLFSASRRAPTSAFSAPGLRTGTDMPTAMTAPRADSLTMAADDSLPRLTGIVMLNGEHQALLQLTAADAVPRLYRVGDVRGGMRIVRIAEGVVVIASGHGTRTLRLSTHAVPDSLEVFL